MYSWTLITGDTPITSDARLFRQALGTFPTGVCLVTTVAQNGKREGMTINSFSSVSLDPPLILWNIRDDARSADVFLAARHFIVSVLSSNQGRVAQHFARPAPDKFAGWERHFENGLGGCPRLLDAAATFECMTYSRHQEGDHTILLGRVESHHSGAKAPLVLHMGQMGSIVELAKTSIAAE